MKKCDIIKTSTTFISMINEIYIKTKKRKFICGVCKKIFKYRWALFRHIFDVHPAPYIKYYRDMKIGYPAKKAPKKARIIKLKSGVKV